MAGQGGFREKKRSQGKRGKEYYKGDGQNNKIKKTNNKQPQKSEPIGRTKKKKEKNPKRRKNKASEGNTRMEKNNRLVLGRQSERPSIQLGPHWPPFEGEFKKRQAPERRKPRKEKRQS